MSLRKVQATVAALAASASLVFFVPQAHASDGVNYVAMGDSYSSGLGAGNYISSSGDCDRSTNSYSALWAAANDPDSYVSVACAGATTSSAESTQLSALSDSTTLVSITIGGNDVDFSSTMEACDTEGTSTCVADINADEQKANNILPGNLDTLFSDISADAPNAEVVVLGYPDFYDLADSSGCIGLSTQSRTAINGGIDDLDSIVQNQAENYGFNFADVRPAFADNEICSDDSWLHSVNFSDIDESYHPTQTGQAEGYYPTFADNI